MAGDWIPYSVDLPRKREVAALSRLCKLRRREVVGILLDFWSWASSESVDGYLRAITIEQLPDLIEDTKPSFWAALSSPEIGWLVIESEGLRIPNCHRWITKSAKLRLQERDKKRRQRVSECPDFVPSESGQMSQTCPGCPPSTGEREGESTEQESTALRKELSASTVRGKISDSEWLESIRTNSAYAHVDLTAELGRMDLWLSANPQRKKTRRFIVNWLNRIEKPIVTGGARPSGNGRYASSSQRNSENIRQFLAEVHDDGETGEGVSSDPGGGLRRTGVGA